MVFAAAVLALFLAVLPQARAAASECVIKGNVNSRGERIYHTPSSPDYHRVKIVPSQGDRVFCTPAEAIAAGFRETKKRGQAWGYDAYRLSPEGERLAVPLRRRRR